MSASAENAPGGALRRKLVLSATERQVRAAVEDDYHHFVVTLEHDGNQVTGVTSEDKRTPWLICANAGSMLQRLVGVPLSLQVYAATEHIDPHEQCTHQFDLALMAIAQAARGGRRQYDIEVTDAVDGLRHARVMRDGKCIIDWDLRGTAVMSPPSMAGANLRQMDVRELASHDTDHAEAVTALRRAVMIAAGRGIDFDQFDDATVFADRMSGACYSFQPARITFAKRNKNSVRDFGRHPELLLRDFSE